MEYIIGIILLFTFFGLAYYCIKGHNLMIGFLIITLIWTILPLGGTLFASQAFLESNPVLQFEGAKGLVGILNKIYQSAPEGWGTTLVNVCWGAWFGRVLMETGIASTLIRKTVELGGDKHHSAEYCYSCYLYGYDRSWPCYRNRRYRSSYSYVFRSSESNCHVQLYGFCCSRYLFKSC